MTIATSSRRTWQALGLATGLGTLMPGPIALALEAQVPLPLAEVNMDGGRSRTEGTIELPPSLAIERATLRVGYANALAVDPQTSTMTVTVGDAPVAELPLVAAQGDVQAEIDVPPGVFNSGSNPIRFTVRQNHRVACERAAFSELWTRIDADASHLALELRPRPAGLTLANLDSVLGASVYDGEPLIVAAARPLDDPALLTWGGLIAEGVALRRGARSLAVKHADLVSLGQTSVVAAAAIDFRTVRGRNLIVVGTFAELKEILPAPLPDGAGLGLVALRPLPADPLHVAVIVSGENDAGVSRAAEAFRSRWNGWPDAAAGAVIGAPIGTPAAAAEPGHVVRGGEAVRLADLGYTSADLPVSFTKTIDVEVVLPETYYAGNGQRVELALDFAYGAGLAPTSSLIIRLNDAPWNMLRLDRSTGAVVEGARVQLPMGLFRPGRNVIGFQPILHPADPGLCATIGDTAMFTLFDDSRLIVPHFANLARQPDLRLFAATGFPFAAADEGVEIVLGEVTPDSVAAAWTLRGKLAQRRGAPLAGIKTVRQPGGERHILALGAPASLPADLIRAAPLPLHRPHDIDGSRPATTAKSAGADRTQNARQHWSQRLLVDEIGEDGNVIGAITSWLVGIARAMPTVPGLERPSFAQLDALGAIGSGTIVAFRSPHARNRTATLITTAGGGTLAQAVDRLIEPGIWNALDGDVSVWSATTGEVLSHRIADPYVIREVDRSPAHLWLLWRTFMSEHPGYWLILVFSLIGILTAVTGCLLKSRARRING